METVALISFNIKDNSHVKQPRQLSRYSWLISRLSEPNEIFIYLHATDWTNLYPLTKRSCFPFFHPNTSHPLTFCLHASFWDRICTSVIMFLIQHNNTFRAYKYIFTVLYFRSRSGTKLLSHFALCCFCSFSVHFTACLSLKHPTYFAFVRIRFFLFSRIFFWPVALTVFVRRSWILLGRLQIVCIYILTDVWKWIAADIHKNTSIVANVHKLINMQWLLNSGV